MTELIQFLNGACRRWRLRRRKTVFLVAEDLDNPNGVSLPLVHASALTGFANLSVHFRKRLTGVEKIPFLRL